MVTRLFSLVFLFLFIGGLFAQQNMPGQRISPKASVSQNIGTFIQVKIDYSSPLVKGREIWGKLVPYGLADNRFGNGKPMPWRAGANENTTVTLSHDGMVDGHPLKAGTYGLAMIPTETDWTIIFSNDYNAWGTFFYDENHDALRITVKPQEAEFSENLYYAFENITPSSATAYLHWEKKKVPFTFSFDEVKITVDEYRKLLTNLAGFNQAAWGQAARYCIQKNYNLDEAEQWIDKALSMNNGNNFNNKIIKAELLNAQGKSQEAEQIKSAAVKDASETELNTYGYQLMGNNQLDEAIVIFKENLKRHPDSWNTYDSMGEALNKKGDKKGARSNYEKALKKAPDNQKSRIEKIIKGL